MSAYKRKSEVLKNDPVNESEIKLFKVYKEIDLSNVTLM